jgi:molecular chaperone HscB
MTDAFDMLGIEPRFDVDIAAAEERHRLLSGALQPDRYAGKPPAERRMALGRAIEVNSAWRVLRDPIKRAECLLARAGIPVGESQEPKPSPALLMEMMEVREELAEARKKGDFDRIGKLADGMRAREKELLLQLERGFAAASGDPDKLKALHPDLGALRYVRRFFDEIEAIEDERMS